MTINITEQIKDLDPSIKPALYRRLMIEKDLSYLRDKHSIIGFEVVIDAKNELAGYTVIAIQKHTILAMCSDLNEKPRLILFPTLAKLRDPEFALGDLLVKRMRFNDDSFQGSEVKEGYLRDLADGLIVNSAEHEDEIQNDVTDAMAKPSQVSPTTPATDQTEPTTLDEPPFDEAPMVDEPPLDDPTLMDAPPFEDEPVTEPPLNEPPLTEPTSSTPVEDPRIQQLNQHHFDTFEAVSDYAVIELGINKDIVNKVSYATINATVNKDTATQIEVEKLLLIKLLKAKKV